MQKILTAVILTIVGAAGIFEALQNSALRQENHLLLQQRAPLLEQVQQLQQECSEARTRLASLEPGIRSNSTGSLSGEQFRELLRLRGTVGVLRRQLAEAGEQVSNFEARVQAFEGILVARYELSLAAQRAWDAASARLPDDLVVDLLR